MTTKEALHRLIDDLLDHEVDTAGELLQSLRDPVLRSLLTAPDDDEPLTDEEAAALTDREAGTISHEELVRELHL